MRAGVFLTIDRALLQRGIQFREGHGCRRGPQCLDHLDVYLVVHDANFQPLHIGGRFDRADIVGHMANPVLHVAEQLDAFGFKRLAQFHADRIKRFIGVRAILEQERHVEDRHLRLEGAQLGGAGQRHVDGAVDQSFDQLFLRAQLGGGEDLDFNLAVRFFLDEFGEVISAHGIGIGFLGDVPQFEHYARRKRQR